MIASMIPHARLPAERANEPRAHILAARFGNAERTGPGQGHNDPKEPFSKAFDGFEHAPKGCALEVRDISRCVAWCPCVFPMAFHGVRGGNRYRVMAKIAYTISTSAPMNHAERPLFVTIAAVRVARRIITTAPGQNWRLIGVGPMT
jgi:hypothetical protein